MDMHVTILCFPCLLSFCRAIEYKLSSLLFPSLLVPRAEGTGFGILYRWPLP